MAPTGRGVPGHLERGQKSLWGLLGLHVLNPGSRLTSKPLPLSSHSRKACKKHQDAPFTEEDHREVPCPGLAVRASAGQPRMPTHSLCLSRVTSSLCSISGQIKKKGISQWSSG